MRAAYRWPLVALGGASVALWGALSAYGLRHPLAETLQRSLAGALGVAPAAVHVGAARVGWPGALVVHDLATPDWSAARVDVTIDLWAALQGRVKLSALRLRDARAALGHVDNLEAQLGSGGQARVALRGVTIAAGAHWLGGLGAHIGGAGLELEDGAVRRLAFAQSELGGVDGLVGAAVRAADGAWLLRAARPGMTATARLSRDGVDGVAHLERMPLGGLPAPRGLELDAASANGSVVFTSDAKRSQARLDLQLTGVTLDHPALVRARVEGVAAQLAGELVRDRDGLGLSQLRVGLGRVQVELDGRLADDGQLSGSVTLPRVGCGELWAALPPALLPRLGGLVLDGEVEARLTLSLDLHDSATLALSLDGNNGCRVRADAALADVQSLLGPAPPTLSEHRVGGRRFALGPANPSWRALSSLPPALVRAFVLAEDSRFFQHHGFDLDRIGHALGANLSAGRFERGASTITQQVVKNLWLDGERTLSRKLEEALLTWRLEQLLDKRRILELYLNLVELGPGTYGVSDGAERYFGKQPEELSADEALQLATLPPAPRRGMDDAWARRYHALAARLPQERALVLPAPTPLATLLARAQLARQR